MFAHHPPQDTLVQTHTCRYNKYLYVYKKMGHTFLPGQSFLSTFLRRFVTTRPYYFSASESKKKGLESFWGFSSQDFQSCSSNGELFLRGNRKGKGGVEMKTDPQTNPSKEEALEALSRGHLCSTSSVSTRTRVCSAAALRLSR